jgi:hypothetical protein
MGDAVALGVGRQCVWCCFRRMSCGRRCFSPMRDVLGLLLPHHSQFLLPGSDWRPASLAKRVWLHFALLSPSMVVVMFLHLALWFLVFVWLGLCSMVFAFFFAN